MDHLGHLGHGQATWNEWVMACYGHPSHNRNPSTSHDNSLSMDMHAMTTIHQYGYVVQVLTGCTHVWVLRIGGSYLKIG